MYVAKQNVDHTQLCIDKDVKLFIYTVCDISMHTQDIENIWKTV